MPFLIVQCASMYRAEDPLLIDLAKGPNCLVQIRYSSHIERLICTRAQLGYDFTWDRNKHWAYRTQGYLAASLGLSRDYRLKSYAVGSKITN